MSRAVVLVCAIAMLGSYAGGLPAAGSGDLPPATLDVRLTRVARVRQPTAIAVRPRDPSLYVTEKAGRVWALGAGTKQIVLDLRSDVTDLRGKSKFGEQGLLALAFPPDGDHLYVYFTDREGDVRVRSYLMREGPDGSTARDILHVHQPHAWHNGGGLAFGPDGYLYVGLGDGGLRLGAGAQRLDTLLGKLLRIDPRPAEEVAYRIPPDNPFVGRAGVRPEIFAYGLRNPWRFAFDRKSGDMWVTDVGENDWEEINLRPGGSAGGENYGWNAYEGPEPFVPRENNEQPVADLNRAGPYVTPVYAYPHPGRGCTAVVGGYPYRGRRLPGLVGAYVFGDLCRGWIRAIEHEGGSVTGQRSLDTKVPLITAFGEDHRGELYVLSLMGDVFRIDQR